MTNLRVLTDSIIEMGFLKVFMVSAMLNASSAMYFEYVLHVHGGASYLNDG